MPPELKDDLVKQMKIKDSNIAYFIRRKHHILRPQTRYTYVLVLRQFKDFLGRELTEAKTEDIEEYLLKCLTNGESHSTVLKKSAAIASFYSYLAMKNKMKEDPSKNVEKPVKSSRKDEKQKKIRFLEQSQINRVFSYLEMKIEQAEGKEKIRYIRVLLEFSVMMFSGLRVGEARNLDMDHFHTDSRRPVLEVINGKGGKNRDVPLNKQLLSNFLRWRQVRPVAPNKAVFINLKTRERLCKYTLQRRVGEITKEAIGRNINAHALRHTFGTTLAAKGCPVQTIRELMGHQSLDTSMIYIHLTDKALSEAVSALFYETKIRE